MQRPALPEVPLRHRVTEDGLDRLRTACPGWDRQWMLLRFCEFMADKPAPNNADAALVAGGEAVHEGPPAGVIIAPNLGPEMCG